MPSGPNVQKNKTDGVSCSAKGSGSSGTGAGGGSIHTDLNRNIAAQVRALLFCNFIALLHIALGRNRNATSLSPTTSLIFDESAGRIHYHFKRNF